MSTPIHSPPAPSARLYAILSAWQVAAVSFGCICVRLWLKNYPPRDLEYYLREDPILTRLVLLAQAMGLWALLLPVLYWWFAYTRRNPPPLSMALFFTAGVTFLYALAAYQAFVMAFGPIIR